MRPLPIVTAILASLACASGGAPTVVSNDRRTEIDVQSQKIDIDSRTHDLASEDHLRLVPEEVYLRLPEIYESLGFKDAGYVDTAGGKQSYGVRGASVRRSLGGKPLSTYIDCGTGAATIAPANAYQITLTVVTVAAPDSANGTLLQTLVSASARDMMTNSPAVHCTSTGKLEAVIAAQVASAP